ncbi:MAG: cytochrome C oxidase subunit IV family protein [Gemmataceae bacterium]|nr:cytochrome C oxidase subunit IV family protein [Gemmataceae bacterium]
MHSHISLRTYTIIFVSLLVLTGLTVLASRLPLGAAHMPVGLIIASTKAMLVILFFMHVIHSDKVTWLYALGGVYWLFILIGLTMADYLSRPVSINKSHETITRPVTR